MLIHPFDELYTVVIVSVYKTGMSCTLPENPFGIRDSICHCLSYKWRAKIRNTAADQRRYLDFSKSVNVFKVFQCSCRCKLIWSPSFYIRLRAGFFRSCATFRRVFSEPVVSISVHIFSNCGVVSLACEISGFKRMVDRVLHILRHHFNTAKTFPFPE